MALIKNKNYNEYTTRTYIQCKHTQDEYENSSHTYSNVHEYCNKYNIGIQEI